MNLVLLEQSDVDAAGRAVLSDSRAAHLLDVLRVTGGQEVRVGMVDGPRGTGTVTAVTGRTVNLACTFERGVPPRPPVDLLLALPRPKVMRRLWAPLAALGVGQIILTSASRVERDYFDTHILSAEAYRPLLIEGLQQARDTRLPVVSIHRRFKLLVEDHLDGLFTGGCRLVADPRSDARVGQVSGHGGQRVLLAIGPEGGWNPFELELLAAHGFVAVGMGTRTLRTDTACVALLALVHAAIEGRLV